MTCSCIKQINQAFKRDDKNSVLEAAHIINIQTGEQKESTVRIKVDKRDSRKRERAVALIPAFCPFCGVKYDEAGDS